MPCTSRVHPGAAAVLDACLEAYLFFPPLGWRLRLLRSISGKESTCNAGDMDLIPGWGRAPREGNGNPPQYSCLANHMDRGARWATVHGVLKELDITELLSMHRGGGSEHPLGRSDCLALCPL